MPQLLNDNNIVYVGFETNQVDKALIAEEFRNDRYYGKGELCWNGGILYQCDVDFTELEGWVEEHWHEYIVSDTGKDVGRLQKAFDINYTGYQLFDRSTAELYNCWVSTGNHNITWNSDGSFKSVLFAVKPSTTYTISVAEDYDMNNIMFGSLTEMPTPFETTEIDTAGYYIPDGKVSRDGRDYYTFTSKADSKYMLFYIWKPEYGYSLEDKLSTIMITEGSDLLEYEGYNSKPWNVIAKLQNLPADVQELVGRIRIVATDLYLYAIVDQEDHVLFSIDKFGKIDWPEDYCIPLKNALETKVDKVEGKSLINRVYADGVSNTDDDSYAYVITDNEENILFSIDKKTGKISGNFDTQKVNFYSFATVEDMKNCTLPNIEGAQTFGFHYYNDGGAAKYIILDTPAVTVDDHRCFALANGKYAHLIFEENYLYPEQVGYDIQNPQDQDLRTFLFVIVNDCKINEIRFHNRAYWIRGPWIVPHQGISLIGVANSGDQRDDNKWYYTRILFTSTRTDTGACVFNCEFREFTCENLEIRNVDREYPSKPGRIGIYTYKFYDDPEEPDFGSAPHYDMRLKNLRINDFREGMNLTGNIKWDLQIQNVRCSRCDIGCRIYGHALVANFALFYPDHCGMGIYIDTLTVAVTFDHCNFGTTGRCVVFDKGYEGNPYGQYTFTGCNFELDAVPEQSNDALFVSVNDDIYRAMLTFIGCNFNFSKIEDSEYASTNYAFRFGAKTEATFIGCQLTDGRWNKQVLNPNYPAKRALGSVKIIHSENVDLPDYADEYIPTFDKDGTIKTMNKEILDTYYLNDEPGKIVYDMSNDKAYVKLASSYKEI